MMSVEPTAAATATRAAPAGLFGGAGADFNMFLKLLTTQMQNQDPLDPMDTSQYTQQLVQYSQVEQSIQQTGLLRDLLGRMSANDMTEAAGLIGREAEFDSVIAGLGGGAPASWSWTLPRGAATLTGEVVDSGGRTVATTVLDPASTGGRYSWDGQLAGGGRAPEGAYQLKLSAKNAAGNSVPVTVRSVGTVDEVMQSGGELWLKLGGASLPLSDLVRVAAPPTA
nr:flagellar hook assembly protein FlgD [uncultured Sphingomonas sp.]